MSSHEIDEIDGVVGSPEPVPWSRARVADALWDGRMSPREAGALFPDMLVKAGMWGVDLDARLNLDDPVTAGSGSAVAAELDDGADEGWGS